MNEPGTVIGMLAVTLIGLLGVVAIVRRVAPQLGQRLQRAGRLQQLGFLALTPQCSVALVQVEREILVLGLTPQTVTLLTKTHDFDAKEEKLQGTLARARNSGLTECPGPSVEEAETTR